jgi:hypothetical protein
MIKFLRSLGVTSDVAYLAGVLSIGASIAAWTASSRMENAPGRQSRPVGHLRRPVGPHLHGPRQRHQARRDHRRQGRRDQLSASQNTPGIPAPRR